MYICSICCKEIHEYEKDDGNSHYPLMVHCMGCFRSFHGSCCFNAPTHSILPIPMQNETVYDPIEFELTFVCQFCKFFQDTELDINGEKFMPHNRDIFKSVIESLAEWTECSNHYASPEDRKAIDIQQVKSTKEIKRLFELKTVKKGFTNLQVYHPEQDRKFSGLSTTDMYNYSKNENAGYSSILEVMNKYLHIITMIGFMKEDETKQYNARCFKEVLDLFMVVNACPSHYYHENIEHKPGATIRDLPICQKPHKIALFKDRSALKLVTLMVYNKYQKEYLCLPFDERFTADNSGIYCTRSHLLEIEDVSLFKSRKPNKVNTAHYDKAVRYLDALSNKGIDVQKTICTIDEDEHARSTDVQCQTSFEMPEVNIECIKIASAINEKKDEMQRNIEKALKEDENEPRENYCDICLYKSEHVEAKYYSRDADTFICQECLDTIAGGKKPKSDEVQLIKSFQLIADLRAECFGT